MDKPEFQEIILIATSRICLKCAQHTEMDCIGEPTKVICMKDGSTKPAKHTCPDWCTRAEPLDKDKEKDHE